MEFETTFFIVITLVYCVSGLSAKYEGYQVWRINPTSNEQMKWLSFLAESMDDEFDFWTGVSRIPGLPVDVMVGPDHRDTLRMLLKQRSLEFRIMIHDVNTLVTNQMAEIFERRKGEQSNGTGLINFDYNVYHTYEEIQQWVADIANEYSDIVSPFVLGHSYEGREINGLRIRGTGSQTPNPPGVWFEGGIHACEWISPATVMGFSKKLLDEYRAREELAVRMFDNIDWYIVPSLNVDGYSYTWTKDRLWRKTRSTNYLSKCTGTDPNRNWSYKWGGAGASKFPCSERYRGSNPLSEVEVASVVRFLREKKADGQDFVVFIDWHSYSQVFIAPWGYRASHPRTKDYNDQMALAIKMSTAIQNTHGMVYGYGAGAEIMYAAAGSAKDWGYADFSQQGSDKRGGLGAKYSYTVELRDTGEYGFLLPEDQIQGTYEEIHGAVRALGVHILNEVGDREPLTSSKNNDVDPIAFENEGLAEGESE